MRMLTRLLAVTGLTFGSLCLAGAASAATDTQVVTTNSLAVVQTLSLLVGVFLPILVALVTKVTTSPSTKAILLAALSTVSAFITTYINDTAHFHLFEAVLTAVTTFVVAVATYYGLWKPTGVTSSANTVGVK